MSPPRVIDTPKLQPKESIHGGQETQQARQKSEATDPGQAIGSINRATVWAVWEHEEPDQNGLLRQLDL
jgi:hypothetical protein